MRERIPLQVLGSPNGSKHPQPVALLSRHREVMPAEQKTILVVEDEDIVRALIVEVLSELGFAVLEANNGVEALRLCQQVDGKINLLITDLIMPEMGGVQLVKRVLASSREIRTIFVSGYDSQVIDSSVLNNGMAIFIRKPFSVTELTNQVRKALDS